MKGMEKRKKTEEKQVKESKCQSTNENENKGNEKDMESDKRQSWKRKKGGKAKRQIKTSSKVGTQESRKK